MVVRHNDFVTYYVYDVCIFPYSLRGQRFAAHFQAIQSVVADAVLTDQWSNVVFKGCSFYQFAGRTAPVGVEF